jgi:DNA-binding winged helix-turn-helix (wHTH) protein/tetratricopeptide (TPR) repeat protein
MIYAFGSYELDTRIYEIRNSGKVRPVEPQVFDVLAYLVSNRDRVVSKEELLEKLWPDRFVSEATLTSRLKEARKAVGDDGRSQSVIRTHHGRGYRFVAEVDERDGSATAGFTDVSGEYEVRAARSHEEPATGSPAAAQTAGTFVGRQPELTRLEQIFATVESEQRRIVFVTGEAGAGKTTLVERFLAGCGESSILIARGQCVEHRGSGEPYMPLLDAIGRLCRTPYGTEIVEVLRREAPTWLLQMPWLLSGDEAAVPAVSGGERMLRELGIALERLTRERPLVLVLEDLHWSDYATLEAIDLLARQPHPARLLILGTFRPSDVKAARHPVYAIAQELRARGQCEMISLPLLAARELEDYLGLRFPEAAFNGDLSALLHDRTSGNALFVTNLIDSWVSRGLIVQQQGRWVLDAPLQALETDVPETLQQLIEKEISALDPEQQRMLETASIAGREFTVAIVAATLPADDDDLERECEALARQGTFIREAGSEQWGDGTITSRFAFIHDLYVDILYDRIPSARRARTHKQVGLALERAWQGRERERAAELALHFQRALDRERGIRYLELAAEQAIDRSAYREAVLHLTNAVELLERSPHSEERDRRELETRSRLAPALVATRGWADTAAEQNYLRATDLARALGDVPLLSRMLYGTATMYEYRGEYKKAELIANERIALDGETSQANSVESHELLACSLLHQGRYQESVEHGARALAAALESGVPSRLDAVVLLVQAHGWMSAALFFAGRPDDAVVQSEKALELAERSGDDLAKASALIQASFLHFYRGETQKCSQLAEAGAVIARDRRFPFHVACGRILSGWCLSQKGQAQLSAREIRGGIRTSAAIGARMDVPLFHAMLADSLRSCGDLDGALHALDDALALVNRNRSFFYLPDLYRQAGDILVERGDRETGLGALHRALALAEEQQSPLFALRAATSIARVDRSAEALGRLRSIFESFHQALEIRDLQSARQVLES